MAVLFVFVLFISKNTTLFKNESRSDGLVYNGNEKIEDLINRDTDLDGVSDWQEGIYGTDPTKKDTNDDGIPDNIEIARMSGQTLTNGELNLNIGGEEDKTQTGLLSRELFSTLATLNQAGQVDQDTIDKLSASLADKIQTSSSRKTFVMAELKITKTDTLQDVKNYNDSLNKIYTKYPIKYTVLDTLDKFIIDEDNVDENALLELDPIIKQTNNIINETAKMNVPPSLASLHLNVLNAMQKVSENISDIKLYNTDIVIAMSAISGYSENATTLEQAVANLENMVNQRLE